MQQPIIATKRPTEQTPLLSNAASAANGVVTAANEENLRQARKLDDAARARIAYSSEFRTIMGYTLPILSTHFLEFSLTASTVLFLGHLGETELASASLGNLTSNVLALSYVTRTFTSRERAYLLLSQRHPRLLHRPRHPLPPSLYL